MISGQMGCVGLRGTSIIRRIHSVEAFILAGNLLCWAACKTSFGGEQHICQECDLPFFSPFHVWPRPRAVGMESLEN